MHSSSLNNLRRTQTCCKRVFKIYLTKPHDCLQKKLSRNFRIMSKAGPTFYEEKLNNGEKLLDEQSCKSARLTVQNCRNFRSQMHGCAKHAGATMHVFNFLVILHSRANIRALPCRFFGLQLLVACLFADFLNLFAIENLVRFSSISH